MIYLLYNNNSKSMYIAIRKYTTEFPDQVIDKIQTGFVPIISKVDGFISYYVVPINNNQVIAVNLFDSEFHGQQSNDLAKAWIDENIAYLYSAPVEIMQGEAAVAV